MEKKTLDYLRNSPTILHFQSEQEGQFTDADFQRMILVVEEFNGWFEAFCIRSLPGDPARVVNYPVVYSDDVQEGEMFGGMWADLNDDGIPKHDYAFVHMQIRKSV